MGGAAAVAGLLRGDAEGGRGHAVLARGLRGAEARVSEKGWADRFATWARNRRSPQLFEALRRHSRGRVVDVGGWDFFASAAADPGIRFSRWTCVEPDPGHLWRCEDPRYEAVAGDGAALPFQEASFETAVSVQVLEHVLDPLKAVEELARVLAPGGTLILLIPQTSVLHHAPRHYYNFTRYWGREALARAGLQVTEERALGGLWSTTASHLVHFFLKSARAAGYSTAEDRRGVLFRLLWPLMAAFALGALPFCLLFSLADLAEDPNNLLFVARKPAR